MENKKRGLGSEWNEKIRHAIKKFENWENSGKQVIRRYRDERDALNKRQRKFNILWSNIQVLKPALYGRVPQPEVTRRFSDKDPVGRAAAMLLQRSLEYEVQQYPDFDAALSNAVEDRLLPGRGTAWVRYEAKTSIDPTISEDADSYLEKLDYECAPCDYVHWKDFLHEPARTWEEVTWVARRVYMDKEAGVERFGEIFALVPMCNTEEDKEEKKEKDFEQKGVVWEVWDKKQRKVVWVSQGVDRELDLVDDPWGIDGFFPCPKPLYATTTTDSLVPISDYVEYQDHAEEIDKITQRISKLTNALKVVGVYNAEFPQIKRLLEEGVDNTMIPVDTWAAFAEKQGLDGSMQMMSIKEVVGVLVNLYDARERCKQTIYEIIGISDILRGSTNPGETLGAQQLKAQFGSMRLKIPQREVARFASDLLRIKAQIISTKFSDDTLIKMSGIEFTDDVVHLPAALELLRSGDMRDFRIAVNSDTLAEIDENKEKEEAHQFLKGISAFLEKAFPMLQAAPQMGPLVGDLLMFGVRSMKAGRTLENKFESTIAALNAEVQRKAEEPGIPPEIQQQIQQASEQIQSEREEVNKEKENLQIMKSDIETRSMKFGYEEKISAMKKGFDEEVQAVREGRNPDQPSLADQVSSLIVQVAQLGEMIQGQTIQQADLQNQQQTLIQAAMAPKPIQIQRDERGRASSVIKNGVRYDITRNEKGDIEAANPVERVV